eukprot:CAMPEP_0202005624 /NCGR_PEP_ID=MMETSP0905-20130828/10606_1 /ASSEMBLY_ACC=CAM_ASM_000554 /TAXON_ID=420261 /ORGANISM="Thalassiosira antarctica, Strain CCMP982" /LENGTH=67 /DNA_ID=CAMNT_0048563217 /DNA_START=202 /DNA_END=405 /DNA_ORIENTATION=-
MLRMRQIIRWGMMMVWFDGWTKGQVLITIRNFGGLGVVRGFGRESGDLDAFHIGEDAVELLKFGCDR